MEKLREFDVKLKERYEKVGVTNLKIKNLKS